MRSSLVIGKQFPHPKGTGVYRIVKIIGTGASCIVYQADFSDDHGFVTSHLLKEYYPASFHIERLNDGSLVVAEYDQKNFEAGLRRFRESFELQQSIRRIEGLTNSTGNIQGVFYTNGTAYIDMSVLEGQTYEGIEEPSLYQMLRRMKALAKVIGNYHKAGFLHLDIKPSNFFVFPETPEMVMLFDFDSVIQKKEISAYRGLSYTKEWAAPEQLAPSQRSKICEATDLYAIGEIIYTQIFGRHSQREDRRSFSSFSYEFESPLLKKVNPKVFPLLTDFLRKTLCGMPEKRYQSVDELLGKLDVLIALADPTHTYVKSNFTYQSVGFYGRRDLLCKIHSFFAGIEEEKGNALFLSGVGGIGKTELAKRYAYECQKDFDRIIFLPFQHSIEETVCQESLQVYHGNSIEEKSNDISRNYENQLRVLKDDLTPNDLIILDNFDVDDLEGLRIADLLDLNCKILITSRTDFSDYDYPQIIVSAINDMNDLWGVFHQYNQIEYPISENQQIEFLMDFVDFHTMTVCLIAKYLRITEILPSELVELIRTKEGITATQDTTRIRHRKDRCLTNKSIQNHLHTLFDLSRFSLDETVFLSALSLFGPVRIAKDTLREIFGQLYQEETVNGLVKKGWVEHSADKTISLHQIILDLVYKTITEGSAPLDSVICGMKKFIQSPSGSRSTHQGKCTLAKYFLERIRSFEPYTSEQRLAVAELYYFYHTLDRKNNALENASELCTKLNCTASQDLLFNICLAKIIDDAHRYEDTMFVGAEEDVSFSIRDSILKNEIVAWEILFGQPSGKSATGTDIDNHLSSLAYPDLEICSESDRVKLATFLMTVPVIPNLSNVHTKTIEKLVFLAHSLDTAASILSGLEMELDMTDAAYQLYYDEECILRYAYLLNETTGQSYHQAEAVLEHLSSFYSADDYTQFARISRFSDPEKSAYYANKVRNLQQLQSPDCIFLCTHSYMDAAFDESQVGNYQKAIELLKIAQDNNESLEDDILMRMAENYEHQGLLEDAYHCTLAVLDYDQQNNLPNIGTLMELARICTLRGEKEQSIIWYNRIIEENGNKYDLLSPYYQVKVLSAFCLRADLEDRYRIEGSLGDWICERLVDLDSKEHLDSSIVVVFQHIFTHLRSSIGFQEATKYVLKVADNFRKRWQFEEAETLYTFVCCLCFEEHCLQNICFEASVKAAEICISETYNDYSKLLEILEVLREEPGSISELNLARYNLLQVTLYRLSDDYSLDGYSFDAELCLRRKCDYYLIAENDANNACSITDAVSIWKNARDEYMSIDDYSGAEKCCIQLERLLKNEEKEPDAVLELIDHYENKLRIFRQSNNSMGVFECVEDIYKTWGVLGQKSNTQEYQLTDSMQRTIAELFSLQEPVLAIYIGLLRIHRLLEGENCVFRDDVPLYDQQWVEKQIFHLADLLPSSISDCCRDAIQETLNIITSPVHSLFPDASSSLNQFQKVCSVSEIEEKHTR